MGYTVGIEQKPHGGFVAHVPALSGCVIQGDSRDDAFAYIRKAIQLYVDDCIEADDSAPRAARAFLHTRIR